VLSRDLKFITVFTKASYWPLSWASWIKSPLPHLTFLKKNHFDILLPFVSRRSTWLFLYGYPTNNLRVLLDYLMRATSTTHLILTDLIIPTILDEQYTIWCSQGDTFRHLSVALFCPHKCSQHSILETKHYTCTYITSLCGSELLMLKNLVYFCLFLDYV
jgi:hypothetical protein